MVGTSVSKIEEDFCESRGTMSNIMSAFWKTLKSSSNKQQRGPKCMYTDSVRRALQWDVIKNKKSTAANVTAELNTELIDTILSEQKQLEGISTDKDVTWFKVTWLLKGIFKFLSSLCIS